MGFALAAAAKAAGARVVVVSGPTQQVAPAGVAVVRVSTALEMRDEVLRRVARADAVIGAAAVTDWRVAGTSKHKIKRASRPHTLRLTLLPNPDIIKDAAARRRPGQVFVGFALETCRATIMEKYARAKLLGKGLDLVVANGLGALASGRIRATLVGRRWTRRLPLGPKSRVARVVVAEVERLLFGITR